MKTIRRDSFGRFDVVRKAAEPCYRECAWCGAKRDMGFVATGLPVVARLYQYGYWSDGGRGPRYVPKGFCSVSCARSYGVEA